MKIGIYNPRVGTKPTGGTETFVREMMDQIDEDILLVTGEGELLDSIAQSNVEVMQVPVTYKESRKARIVSNNTPVLGPEIESVSMLCGAKRSGALDALENCDVVSTHYYLDNLLLSRTLDAPTMFRFPGIKQPSIRWRYMFKYDQTDRYVSNSQSTTNRLKQWYGENVSDIVYAGVNTDRFHPQTNYAINGPMKVLFVGRLESGKGVSELVTAISRSKIPIELEIVGDGDKRQDYEQLAKDKLAGKEYTFRGNIDHSEIHTVYQEADVFSLPSHHESFGIAIMEAMASGLPVIAPAIDAVQRYASDNQNALLINPGNVGELVEALSDLYMSAGLRQKLGGAARQTGKAHNWDRQAKRMLALYRDVGE